MGETRLPDVGMMGMAVIITMTVIMPMMAMIVAGMGMGVVMRVPRFHISLAHGPGRLFPRARKSLII